jgi:hypothetical protein
MPRIVHDTSVADTVAVVTLDADYDSVEVMSRGESDIYFRVDGEDPTVEGDDCYLVLAGGFLEVPVPGRAGSSEIRLISTDATAYSVTGVL